MEQAGGIGNPFAQVDMIELHGKAMLRNGLARRGNVSEGIATIGSAAARRSGAKQWRGRDRLCQAMAEKRRAKAKR